MKNCVLLLLIALPFIALGQNAKNYQFSIHGVTTPADAKVVSEVMYPIFDAMPKFNDLNDQFECNSTVTIEEAKLSSKLGLHGYTLSTFTKPKN